MKLNPIQSETIRNLWSLVVLLEWNDVMWNLKQMKGTILRDRQVKCTTTLVSEFGIPSAHGVANSNNLFFPKENVKHLRVVIDELATEILKAIWKRLQWCTMWSDYHASDAAKLLNWRKDSAPIIKDVYSWRKHPWLVWSLKRTPATKPPRDFSRGKRQRDSQN